MAERKKDSRAQFRIIAGGRRDGAPPAPLDVFEVPADRSAPRKARRWAAVVAAGQGVTGMANQMVELLTGELVGLAVVHSAPGAAVRVEVTTVDGFLEVSAHHVAGDDGVADSVLNAEEWGTALLRTLSADCGIGESDGGCLTSWFRLDPDA
ncbi:ATP-binding protein [Georgenia sp. MJ206]|uniref:ATP-binding protein n=1 Tax=Georgenia wangjunii TaxID=3117730 RepID=UPI002F26BE9A